MYKIKPFKWEHRKNSYSEEYLCDVPFGRYFIRRHREDFQDDTRWLSWEWGYCFDEYSDDDSFECVSAKEGKQKCWGNWLARIKKALIEVRKEGE